MSWESLLDAYLASARGRTGPEIAAPSELLALPPAERLAAATAAAAMLATAPRDWIALARVERDLLSSLRAEETPSEPLALYLATLGRVGGVCGHPWDAAWKIARSKITRSGIDPVLHDGLRALQPAMTAHQSDKNARIAIDRALWFEAHLPIDVDSCASGIVKRDLRNLPSRSRKAWERLLAHGMIGTHAEPKPSWPKKADALVEKVGPDEVRARVCGWLAEIGTRRTLRFEAAGADVARGLVWIGAMHRDDSFDAAVVAIADREWTRSSRDGWSPRHDRFVGALVYAIGLQPYGIAVPIVRALEPRFRRTTARYPIERVLAASPASPTA